MTAMRRALRLAAAASVVVAPVAAQERPSFGSIERVDPRIDALIPADARIDVLASGFEWAEGPVWVPDGEDGALLFSDIPRNQILRWRERQGLDVYLEPSGYTGVAEYGREPGSNGLALDSEGRLVICEHGDRRVSLLYPDGGKRTLADSYEGKRLNSPNDVVVHSSGALYFTDPPYGLPDKAEDPRKELEHSGVYRVSPEGEVSLLTTELNRPNGIAFSPDEKTLYVANSDPTRAIWLAFDVAEDGTLGEGRVLHDATERVGGVPGLPDGLKVDEHGNLFATAPGGVLVMDPDGTVLGTIRMGNATANVAFGGDGSALYLTADAYLARIQLSTRGAGWAEEVP
jgi:gluconolactonase